MSQELQEIRASHFLNDTCPISYSTTIIHFYCYPSNSHGGVCSKTGPVPGTCGACVFIIENEMYAGHLKDLSAPAAALGWQEPLLALPSSTNSMHHNSFYIGTPFFSTFNYHLPEEIHSVALLQDEQQGAMPLTALFEALEAYNSGSEHRPEMVDQSHTGTWLGQEAPLDFTQLLMQVESTEVALVANNAADPFGENN